MLTIDAEFYRDRFLLARNPYFEKSKNTHSYRTRKHVQKHSCFSQITDFLLRKIVHPKLQRVSNLKIEIVLKLFKVARVKHCAISPNIIDFSR